MVHSGSGCQSRALWALLRCRYGYGKVETYRILDQIKVDKSFVGCEESN